MKIYCSSWNTRDAIQHKLRKLKESKPYLHYNKKNAIQKIWAIGVADGAEAEETWEL